MMKFKTSFNLQFHLKFNLIIAFILIFIVACNNEKHADVSDVEIVETPEAIDDKARGIIRGTLSDINNNSQDLPDSFRIKNAAIVQQVYDKFSFKPIWSSEAVFHPAADTFYHFLGNSREYGLFPDDYYFSRLSSIRSKLYNDTINGKNLDASLWAYRDLLITSAFVQAVRDIKVGRLLPDSIVARDTSLSAAFYIGELEAFRNAPSGNFLDKFEPVNTDYKKVKSALKLFLDSADLKTYTYVVASGKDSLQLRKLMYKRLTEEDSLDITISETPDSLNLSSAIKQYQKYYKIKQDGKITTSLISRLNNTDQEKFIRVAINMDRFKQLPVLPKQYLWVNMPGFYLQMRDSDTVVLRSKIVVGKPRTRTPVITSAISNMITYPQWHIPESIIKGEILPGLKRDPGYTKKKGYSILDKDGNEVDPYAVDWSKYKKGIPYRVIQGSGDDNALGILKFNFPNTHSVYLHDTNQRYLFSRTNRALSHGCVRVQSWNDLASYILKNDSIHSSNAVPVDSLQTWLSQKKKQYIPVRKPIPLYIRYFTCDVKDDRLVFFDDIYGEDRKYRDMIFSGK